MTDPGALGETARFLAIVPLFVLLAAAAIRWRPVALALKCAVSLLWAAGTIGLAAWAMLNAQIAGAWNQVGFLLGALLLASSWFVLGGRALLAESIREIRRST